MSDPSVSDIDFKNKMAWVRTTLNFWIFLNQNSFQQQKHDKIFMHCSLCGYKSKCPLAMERHRLSRHVHERRIQSTVSITENHKFNPSLMLPMADLSGLSLNRRNSRQACILEQNLATSMLVTDVGDEMC